MYGRISPMMMADAATLPKQSFHFFRQMLFMSNLQGKLDDGRARNREREREWLIKPNNNGLLVERYLISTRHSYRNGR